MSRSSAARKVKPLDLVGRRAERNRLRSEGTEKDLFTDIFCENLMVMLSEQQVQEKVLQYEAFISDVLQRDLKKVLEQRDEIYEKIAQYLQLKNIIERLQETGGQELTTQVDLGCHFYVNAEVPDTSTIFIALGYGFFVELTLPEALTFIEKKSKLLTELSEALTKDSAKIKANIRMVLEGLRELQGFEDLPEENRRDIFL